MQMILKSACILQIKEKKMDNEIEVLDHGFVKLRNLGGPVRRPLEVITDFHDGITLRPFDADDIDPAITARISFDNLDEVRTKEEDMRLVEYLIKNNHNTPLEMIEVWLEMKLPIFIARQFVRHRTATINEVSARYAVLPAEWYIPEVVGGKASSNKQGQENNLAEDMQSYFKDALNSQCASSYKMYKYYLEQGVAPEHARMFLHVNHYTHWVWKQDLHNLMHFLALRLDIHAQVEARAYAQAIYDLLAQYLPETMKLFDKYRRM